MAHHPRFAFDGQALVDAVLASCTNRDSTIHGIHHWQCVAWTGRALAREVPDADASVVLLFAIFHDSMRWDDGYDPEHGRRAGAFMRTFAGTYFDLEPPRLELLQEACDGHVDGRLAENPTVGVCWDADRLNLWRVGIEPNPKYLSTAPARGKPQIRTARALQKRVFRWKDIFDAYRG
ncbi:MAG: hypothetical protein M5U26_13925 [Planctomycetota bacterium]|nr:hypothetical protein [Planctomycetota bacterium]